MQMVMDAIRRKYLARKNSTPDLRPSRYSEVEDNIVCAERDKWRK